MWLQIDNVADKEGKDAVRLDSLRADHPTLYWNVVVVVLAAELVCPLDFLLMGQGVLGGV